MLLYYRYVIISHVYYMVLYYMHVTGMLLYYMHIIGMLLYYMHIAILPVFTLLIIFQNLKTNKQNTYEQVSTMMAEHCCIKPSSWRREAAAITPHTSTGSMVKSSLYRQPNAIDSATTDKYIETFPANVCSMVWIIKVHLLELLSLSQIFTVMIKHWLL